MLKLQMLVDVGEGPVEVTTNLYSEVAWERKFKIKAFDIQSGKASLGIEDLAFLAWETMKSQKIVVPAMFDDFLKRVIDIQTIGGDEPRPTEKANQDGS